jgi:hypothetical protein
MRFRPIGFGDGETGKIGSTSSSTDGSSDESTSDRESRRPASQKDNALTSTSNFDNGSGSTSDAEMIDLPSPPPPPKKASKPKRDGEVSNVRSELKRKH